MLGNPSDGYEGKVIACPVGNFATEVRIEPAPTVSVAAGGDALEFTDLDSALHGPWPAEADGLEMLVLAGARRLVREIGSGAPGSTPGDRTPDPAGLRIRCATTIPRQVGLSGSSAAIIATMRALATHWGLSLSPFELAEMALATETEDLGIAAGPMDRVIQAYEQAMVLDLAPPRRPASYARLQATLPPLLIAWAPSVGRSSDVTHSDLRARWLSGDPGVRGVMRELAALVPEGVTALIAGDTDRYADLVDRNFDLRCSVTDVGEADVRMVGLARALGAGAKLCGSGGATLVVPRRSVAPQLLEEAYGDAGFQVSRLRSRG